jgi:hypothetical protein
METQTKESTFTDVEEVNNNDSLKTELIERVDVKGTPFTVISTDEKHFGVMGGFRITENMESVGEVEDELKCITWNRIVQVMMILNELKEEASKAIKEELTENKK